MKVALLGTGLMGTPMVKCLSAAGHEVHIWNRSPEKASALSEFATAHLLASDAVQDAEIVICMLSDGIVTTDLLIEQKVMQACKSNSLLINMGSVEPERDRNLARASQSQSKRYLDAPVSGGVKGAEDASLSIFVGGERNDMDFAMPVLTALGRPNYMGPHGAGQTAKLANQLIVAITIGAVAEAFQLAEHNGCDIAVLQKALQGGFADSRILIQHGERMVQSNFEPGGRSRSQLKDIRNAQAVAAASQLDLPLSKTVEQSFQSLVDDYDGGDLDHSAYFLWLKKRLGETGTT